MRSLIQILGVLGALYLYHLMLIHLKLNDIWFEIYDCSGYLYLQAGAPYEGYTELPNNFNIIIPFFFDASGDGWNEGSNIYIDGYGDPFSLENGYYDTISNCDENNIDNNNDGDDNDNDWGDNIWIAKKEH